MADNYNIYLVNESENNQNFWLFLQPPAELAANPKVFANSSACLTVRPNTSSINKFTVPVQYKAGAGASNEAVGLNVQITSDISLDIDLQQACEADYYNVSAGGKQGPDLKISDKSAPEGMMSIITNKFNQAGNEDENWYSNQSFGIETEAGFIGMTWSPEPNKTRTLTPKLAFYVSTGDFGENSLAQWTDVSNDAAEISVQNHDFDHLNCTVTYNADGTWKVMPGSPAPQLQARANLSENLVSSHLALCKAHESLIAMQLTSMNLAAQAEATSQEDEVSNVEWDIQKSDTVDDATFTYLVGTLSVKTALVSAFTFFVLSGIEFKIEGGSKDKTRFKFSYSGSRSKESIEGLFRRGAKIYLSK